MCQWKRYHTIERILDSFLKQTVRFDIYIWNNGSSIDDNQAARLMEILTKYKDAKFNIYIHHSKYNIKCQGRIITAHMLHYLYKNVIFFDDDEIMDNNKVVETFKNEVTKYPNTIFSIWALDLLHPTQFYRRKRRTNNEIVDYAGGGGVIIPSNLFRDHFLKWLPEKFFNVEDFVCNVYIASYMRGYNRASTAEISFIPNVYNSKDSMSFGKKNCDRTGIEIHELKNQCLQWAIKNYNYPRRFATPKSVKPSKDDNRFDPRNRFSVYKCFKNPSSTLVIIFSQDNKWNKTNCFYDNLPNCKIYIKCGEAE